MDNITFTGAIRDKKDKRDYQYSDVGMSMPPFDWDKGYDVEDEIGMKLITKDQNGSYSCGGQAVSYYGQVIDSDHSEKSAKFIYSQVYEGTGGSAVKPLIDLTKNKGFGLESLTTSYEAGLPPKEPFMQRASDITAEAFAEAIKHESLSYASVKFNIDDIAQAIRDNKGCIIGIEGENNGTWRTAFPVAIKVKWSGWNHYLYAGKAKMINGKKYIGIKNSWGSNCGDNGWQWLDEGHMKAIWSVFTLVFNFPKFKFENNLKLGNKNNDVKELQKRLGVIQTGLFWVLTRNAVIEYQKKHGLVPDGIVGVKTRTVLNS